jgi:hypothetical protein
MLLITLIFRRSHTETVGLFDEAEASQVPFSEKERSLTGPSVEKLAEFSPVIME